jgi:hypothetical protein
MLCRCRAGGTPIAVAKSGAKGGDRSSVLEIGYTAATGLIRRAKTSRRNPADFARSLLWWQIRYVESRRCVRCVSQGSKSEIWVSGNVPSIPLGQRACMPCFYDAPRRTCVDFSLLGFRFFAVCFRDLSNLTTFSIIKRINWRNGWTHGMNCMVSVFQDPSNCRMFSISLPVKRNAACKYVSLAFRIKWLLLSFSNTAPFYNTAPRAISHIEFTP